MEISFCGTSPGKVCGIYEGDESVVNIIEAHPRLPILAVSGIDTTVKLFAPSSGPSSKSRMNKVDEVIAHNKLMTRTSGRARFSINSILLRHGFAPFSDGADSGDSDGPSSQCRNQ